MLTYRWKYPSLLIWGWKYPSLLIRGLGRYVDLPLEISKSFDMGFRKVR